MTSSVNGHQVEKIKLKISIMCGHMLEVHEVLMNSEDDLKQNLVVL